MDHRACGHGVTLHWGSPERQDLGVACGWAVRQEPRTAPRGGYLDSTLKDKFTKEGTRGEGAPVLGRSLSSYLLSFLCQSHRLSALHTLRPSASCSGPASSPRIPGWSPAAAGHGHTGVRGNSNLTQGTQAISVSSPPNMQPPDPSLPNLRPCYSPTVQARDWEFPGPYPFLTPTASPANST